MEESEKNPEETEDLMPAKRGEARAATQFTMVDSDEDGEDEEDDEENVEMDSKRSDNFGARLSFMFEHNNLINVRINALANDLRKGNLLPQEEEESMTSTVTEPTKRRQSRRMSSALRKSVVDESGGGSAGSPVSPRGGFNPPTRARRGLVPMGVCRNLLEPGDSLSPRPADSSPRPTGATTSEATNAELRRRIEELEKKLKEVTAAGDKDAEVVPTTTTQENVVVTSFAIPSIGEGSSFPDVDAMERLQTQIDWMEAEGKRAQKEMLELYRKRDLLDKELKAEREGKKQSDKDNTVLRKDLKKCQHVIERLVKELELATKDLAPSPKPAVRKSALKQQPEKPSGLDSSATEGFMTDLSSAIGSFFGELGATKSRPAPSEPSPEECEPDDEVFCWAEDPCSENIEIADDGQTVTFIGKQKSDLHAFVVTEEPPLLEADQGYGFEVLIAKVRSDQEDGLALGFTATPPDEWPEELPETADLIEQTFLVGYNGEMYDGGAEKWHKCPWSPISLTEGDRVGVQVSLDGNFYVVLNQKVVFTSTIALAPDGPPLFGVVDLLGNTESVVLLD